MISKCYNQRPNYRTVRKWHRTLTITQLNKSNQLSLPQQDNCENRNEHLSTKLQTRIKRCLCSVHKWICKIQKFSNSIITTPEMASSHKWGGELRLIILVEYLSTVDSDVVKTWKFSSLRGFLLTYTMYHRRETIKSNYCDETKKTWFLTLVQPGLKIPISWEQPQTKSGTNPPMNVFRCEM